MYTALGQKLVFFVCECAVFAWQFNWLYLIYKVNMEADTYSRKLKLLGGNFLKIFLVQGKCMPATMSRISTGENHIVSC